MTGLVAVAVAAAVGGLRPRWASPLAASAAVITAVAFALTWMAGSTQVVDLPWLPLLGSRMRLALDPLSAPLVVFTAGLAAPILFYAGGYMPKRLAEHGQPPRQGARFHAWMLAFVVAMVLLLLAQDLVILFLALELTAAASYSLIRQDRTEEAERSATLALVLTVGSSFLFLIGVLLVASETGTTVLADLRADDTRASTVGAFCLVGGLVGKSAQVPLHFWLPRAMVAPTPVSAFLHSAAMVAAGVFVIARLRFLMADAQPALDAMVVIGFASIAVGGVLALVKDELKSILAHSTIAQYGYAMVLLGLGGDEGATGAVFFIVAHGLCKCALFLVAGAVTHATGEKRLSAVGGLARRMPWLAGASAIAAIGLAGLPGTVGYFKDELLFAAGEHDSTVVAVMVTTAAALTFAYAARFWLGIFAGRLRAEAERPGARLVAPVVLLAAVVVAGGLWTTVLPSIFLPAGSVVAGRPVDAPFEYHLALRPPVVMAAAAWAGGLLLVATHRLWVGLLGRAIDTLEPAFSAGRWARRLAAVTAWASDRLHQLELRDLRDRVGAVFVPTALLLGLGLMAHGELPELRLGSVTWADAPMIAALMLAAVAAVVSARPQRHLALVLQLSFVGMALGLVFALAGAPNVALVMVVVETALTLLFAAVLWHLRPDVLRASRHHEGQSRRGKRTGLIVGVAAFVVSWVALSNPHEDSVAWDHVRLADYAHGEDVVTVILADFRGLDTAGELTVLVVAVMGAAAISWGERR